MRPRSASGSSAISSASVLGQPLRDERRGALAHLHGLDVREESAEIRAQRGEARAAPLDDGRIQRPTAALHQEARDGAHAAVDLQQRGVHCVARDGSGQREQGRATRRDLERVLGQQQRRHDVRDRGAELGDERGHERHAARVDEPVRDAQRRDLAAQAVIAQRVGEGLAERPREVAGEGLVQVRRIDERALRQRAAQHQLRDAEQRRQLGPHEAEPLRLAGGERLRVRQPERRGIDVRLLAERRGRARVEVGLARRAQHVEREREGLPAVVREHALARVGGGAEEEPVPLLGREPPAPHQRREQDLVVDLVIGEIDAAGVVDRVGVDAHAGQRRLDARGLREAEVAALDDDPRAQLARVDAHRVVGAVADVRVRLERRPHVGADAAVPEQIDGERSIARIRSSPETRPGPSPSRSRTAGASAIDFAPRWKTPPPGEILLAS